MKKKGLIISTVVMVIVLIASLTTATYAWFSSSASAKVENIQLNVGAASKVQIGLGTGTSATGYVYGDGLSWAGNAGAEKWTGGSAGLGTSINTGLLMQVGAGIGSKAADQTLMDATYNKANPLFRGEGDTFNVAEVVVGDAAIINGKGATTANQTDVVELPMGLRIVQNNVYGTYCKITVKPNEGQTFIGMAAALHFEITVGTGANAKSYTLPADKQGTDIDNNDLFELKGLHFDDEVGTNTDGYVFYFMINDIKAAEQLEGEDAPSVHAYPFGTSSTTAITEFSIKFFISGYDQDCCNGATGTGATISLDFETCDTATWTANAAWTQIPLA